MQRFKIQAHAQTANNHAGWLCAVQARSCSPPEATFEDREILREALGLNEPLYVQYWIFITNALHGDFGTSFRYGTSAMGVVMEKIPATVQLASV